MHTNWRELTSDERAVFFNDQQVFSYEKFDRDKVILESVDLDFFEGHRLIRATLNPQTITIKKSNKINLTEVHRPYLLYNQLTEELDKKVVPLHPGSESLHVANRFIGIKLTKQNVVQYAQYFGLIMEADHGSFLFLAHQNEIPWAENVDNAKKLELKGRLSALVDVNESGEFKIEVTENKSIFGDTYSFKMPAIYNGEAFIVNMTVAKDGAIRMDSDQQVAPQLFDGAKSTEPYYIVESTGELRRRQRRSKFKGNMIQLMIFPIVIAFALMGLVGALGNLLVSLDVIVGSIFNPFSQWLNSMIINKKGILWAIFVASIGSLILSVLFTLAFRVIVYIAVRRPGWAFSLVGELRDKMSKKYRNRRFMIVSLVRMSAIALFSALLTWSAMFYAAGNLFDKIIVGEHQYLSLRSAFGGMLEESIGWITFGSDPWSIRDYVRRFFDYSSETVGYGDLFKIVASVSIPFIIMEQVRRVWRFARDDD